MESRYVWVSLDIMLTIGIAIYFFIHYLSQKKTEKREEEFTKNS
jgi:hypothetical protein